jgi:hypothetical protein
MRPSDETRERTVARLRRGYVAGRLNTETFDGRVDREQLLNLSGRSRKPQIQLAMEWGLVDWAQRRFAATLSLDDLKKMKVPELKKLAKEYGIKSRTSWKKEDYIKAIVEIAGEED